MQKLLILLAGQTADDGVFCRMFCGQAEVYKAQRFSDHAPLVVDYDFPP
jgi:hypothetical protein